jgi:predicted nucleic acid-binding protein
LITLDTSGLVAVFDRRDANHGRSIRALQGDPGPYFVPIAILAELAYMLEARVGRASLETFLEDLDAGAFSLECGDSDLPRVRHLLRRYADLGLSLPDAAVIACAERTGGRVLTLDVRDFGVVAREGKIHLLPE